MLPGCRPDPNVPGGLSCSGGGPDWNDGGASAYPPSKNNASCEAQCSSNAIINHVVGLGIGGAYTAAGGPAGLGYAAGSLGLFGSTISYAACLDACNDENKSCPNP